MQHRRAARVWLVAAALLAALELTSCQDDDADAPLLVMPDLVGQPVLRASAMTYDALHTSLVRFDLAPANRTSEEDWVVVATSPAAGSSTPKFTKVYAWTLRASEYAWFNDHPTMPRIPPRAGTATLVGKGGLLAPVKDLVQLRYQPGKAPSSARPSQTDTEPFTPDRGLHPDLATEPLEEFQARAGLRVAPARGTVAVNSRPAASQDLRVGQYLVVLVIDKPVEKSKPSATPEQGFPAPPTSGGSNSGGGNSDGNSGTGSPSLPNGLPPIPNCPKRLCG